MFVKIKKSKGNVLGYNVKGVVSHSDYEKLVPEVEAVVKKHGNVRFYIDISGFEEATLQAMIDDMKMGFKFYGDMERIAVVGNQKMIELMAKVGDLLMKADLRYFDTSEMDEAWAWICKKA